MKVSFIYLKFPALRQELIDAGVNPHVLNYEDDSQYDRYSLASLSNIPSVKSIFFAVISFPCRCATRCAGDLANEWFYQNGVYPGQFGQIIGSGGEGVVVSGFWHGEEAAFKFVPVRAQQFLELAEVSLADLATRLNEMTTLQAMTGSYILKILGHYR